MGKNVVIVDYGSGNLYSITQACKHFNVTPKVTFDPIDILSADNVILPGVGSFEAAMKQLYHLDLVQVLNEFVLTGKPLMGVCLGMQLLFERSFEFGEHNGLGFINGDIKRFPNLHHGNKLRVPHIGWNGIFEKNKTWANTPLNDFKNGGLMYFVHSYYAEPSNKLDVLSTSIYNGFEFCSSINKNNVFGFQFHPEKSGEEGLTLYKNFLLT